MGLPPTLAMSELFGHLAGAFSGAYRDRSGIVWKANGGTLLIHDPQDSMSWSLCRLNETGRVYPLGTTTSHDSVRVRMIVATTEDSGSVTRRGHYSDSVHDWCPIRLRVAAGLGLPRRRMITIRDLKTHLRSA
jgi:transcriptional regulator with AAA-type ATPase domain